MDDDDAMNFIILISFIVPSLKKGILEETYYFDVFPDGYVSTFSIGHVIGLNIRRNGDSYRIGRS